MWAGSRHGRPMSRARARGASAILFANLCGWPPARTTNGECRGEEAFDMLQAMNTGHEGSMTTIHANSPRDALKRLEQMVAMAGISMTPDSLRREIAPR